MGGGGGGVGCALGPLAGVFAQGWDYLAFFFAGFSVPKNPVGCGCHTRAPKPISVSCVSRGAEARMIFSLLVSRSRKTQGRAYERPGQN